MARPKGSTNKPKNTSNIAVLKFEKQIQGAPSTRKSGFDYVNWGTKNNYPLQLLDLYAQSPTHKACIQFGVNSIVGDGVDYEAMQIDGSQLAPNYTQSWDDFIRDISLDYMLYGSYAMQIIKNKDGKTFSFWHMPLDKVRWSEYDEDGQITKYWISNDWTSVGQNVPFAIDAFDMRDESLIEGGRPYLYVYRKYSPIMTYYTEPHYIAGIKSIQAEIEYLNYDLKTTVNGFVPSGMLVLNDMETDEQRQGVIDQVQRMFQGSDNANSVMVSFRGNVEEQAPQWVPFTTNTSNVNLYDSANQRTISRILAAHSVPNAALVGLPDLGNSGFSSEADKLEVSYNLYQKLIGNNNRMAVIGAINAMWRMNGIDVEIQMKPLTFLDEGANKTSDTAEVNEDEVSDNNVEEQVTE